MTDAEKIIKWLDETKADLISNYDRLGLRASGNWANDLETGFIQNKTGYKIFIKGSQYTGVLEYGRKPNSNQENLRSFVGWAGNTWLKDWVQKKGLNISPFAIAYKIGREGIQVPNKFNKGGLVNDVLTKERIDKLVNELGMVYIESIKSDLLKQYK